MKSNGSNEPALVIGVGASAAALDVLQTLLHKIPANHGVAWGIVLPTDARARLTEIVAAAPHLTWMDATDAVALRPDHVYVAPPHRLLGVEHGVLRLVQPARVEDLRTPVDHFLQSLARDQKQKAIGILLSGPGSDGAQGLKSISDAGGMSMVQDPATAAWDTMPRMAAEAGTVDHVLPPDGLVEELCAYITHIRDSTVAVEQRLREDVEADLSQVCEILLQSTGHNFKHYKTSTLVRRVLRRVTVLRLSSARAYLERLRTDRAEGDQLFRELLINVTAFFRDPDAFTALEREVLPHLLRDRPPGEPVRVWVGGCATGEEAYTIAMLFREQIERMEHPPDVQVFATDIDEQALSFARQGIYPLGIADELTPERLKRFFVKNGQSYQVSKALREMMLFSVHNLINDPPFSRLDLISCRNVLIYLGSHLQRKLIPVFHYALRPGGYLFLGPAENLNSHRELFRSVNTRHRISQRLPTAIRPAEVLLGRSGTPTAVRPPNVASASDTDTYLVMQRITLDEFAPKTVVVDDEGHIVCASGNLERYLTVTAGAFQNSVTRLARDGLKVGLRTALKEASRTQRKVTYDGQMLRTEDGVQRVMITVQPMPQLGEESALYYVAFQDVGSVLVPGEAPSSSGPEDAATFIEQLERELATTRDDLEKTVQDLEAANEELKSSNEELLSMNEELVSSNEELETSKEEVQAANDSLSRVNTDLENLLASTRVGTLFLDAEGNIRRSTPAARSVYNLRPGDVGRPLSEITHKARKMPPLPAFDDVRTALRTLEDEVEMEDGTWFLRRASPYRTRDGVAEGVVVTFTDVTELIRAEHGIREANARLAASERLYRAIGESIEFGVWVCTPDGNNTYASQSFLDLTGMTSTECAGLGWTRALHPDDAAATAAAWTECVRTGGNWDIEHRIRGVDGAWHPILARGVPVRDENDTVTCWAGINLDISRLKETERALEENLRVLKTRERELRVIADNIPDALARFDRGHRHVFVNTAGEWATGLRRQEVLGATHRELHFPESWCVAWEEALDRVFTTGENVTFELSHDVNGGLRYLRVRLVPEVDHGGEVAHVLGVTQDITEARHAAEALRASDQRKDEFIAILAHELRNPLAPVRNGVHLLERSRSDAEASGIRRMMDRQLGVLVRLVDDLLDVSRISRGSMELRRQTVDLRSVLDIAIEASRPAIDAAGHALVTDLPHGEVWIDADPARVAQIVNNLLNNAAKYTPNQGRIELVARVDRNEVEVRVSDNGLGIEDGMLSRVFDLFAQADRRVERTEGGLGIGLTLVQRLTEMHGGTVFAESAGPGQGSTFVVRLPVRVDPPDTGPVETDAPIPTGLRILVVDDNIDGADSLASLFELLGHETTVAHTGPDALEAVGTTLPQVVLLDIGLPGMSGYDVARRVRASPLAHQPVLVAMTGWGTEKDRKEAMDAGFDHHLVKPVDFDRLQKVLGEVARLG